jgi:hypothetical protein
MGSLGECCVCCVDRSSGRGLWHSSSHYWRLYGTTSRCWSSPHCKRALSCIYSRHFGLLVLSLFEDESFVKITNVTTLLIISFVTTCDAMKCLYARNSLRLAPVCELYLLPLSIMTVDVLTYIESIFQGRIFYIFLQPGQTRADSYVTSFLVLSYTILALRWRDVTSQRCLIIVVMLSLQLLPGLPSLAGQVMFGLLAVLCLLFLLTAWQQSRNANHWLKAM